jgi:uncharacterized protein
MKLEHEFSVPVPQEQAWAVLLDVEHIAPCMPGATLDRIDGDDFGGQVKVKVGPIQVTYAGTARIVERDEDAHRAVIEATGKEARGPGTVSMTVTAQLHEASDGTRVTTVSDLSITGRPAQFGRGVMADVGAKIIGQFADCLSAKLAAPPAGSGEAPAPDVAQDARMGGSTPHVPHDNLPSQDPQGGERTPQAIDLLDAARSPAMKRVAPALAAAVALIIALLIALKARRRSG